MVKTEGRNAVQNPFLSIAHKCLLQMAQIESEFGLPPSGRSRIRAATSLQFPAAFSPTSGSSRHILFLSSQ